MVICFCTGWSRLTDLKMPTKKKLEAFGEYVSFQSVLLSCYRFTTQQRVSLMARSPFQSKSSQLMNYPCSLGHWIEVNDEIMGMLSRFEPPLEVEEKDATFLRLERN